MGVKQKIPLFLPLAREVSLCNELTPLDFIIHV